MFHMNDLKLRTKQVLGFALMALLMGIPLVFTLLGLGKVDKRLNLSMDQRTRSLQLSARMHRNVFELRTQEKALLLAESGMDQDLAWSRMDSLRREGEERMRELQTLDSEATAQDLWVVYDRSYRHYNRTLDSISALVRQGKSAEARVLSFKGARTESDSVVSAAQRFSNLQEEKLHQERSAAAGDVGNLERLALVLVAAALLLGLLLAFSMAGGIARAVTEVITATESIAGGNLDTEIKTTRSDELGIMARAVVLMQKALKSTRNRVEEEDWLKSRIARLNNLVLGQDELEALCTTVVGELAAALDAQVGALYAAAESEGRTELVLLGTYAYTRRKNLSNLFKMGEGLVGQAALEGKQILLEQAPEDYIRVVSGLGESAPRNICVTPILYEGRIRGVVELATLQALSPLQQRYLEQAAVIIAMAFEIVHNQRMVSRQQEELQASNEELQAQARVLEKSQDELRAQQQELESANVELETQMLRVRESEERLRTQQEELEVTNEELKSKNTLLERQKSEIEAARSSLSTQAEELALASKYKSEFLANMSHELRTPLNSLLLLAGDLRSNNEGNLSGDQQESARIIYDSGSDLLNLINEILDLSKIEAGRMELRLERVELTEIRQNMTSQFAHMAQSQGLSFAVEVDEELPAEITTDPQRLGQVIKNLVGNALKFTESGGVTVRFTRPGVDTDLSRSRLDLLGTMAIQVIDTGIGIPLDKQKVIFEAFQQADSGDRRRYGGTGLGLSISRELARLLGGEIQLESTPGKGSTFTIYVPLEKSLTERRLPITAPQAMESKPSIGAAQTTQAPAPRSTLPVDDDRDKLEDGGHCVLVIEDDERFARVLAGHIRRRGLKVLLAFSGEEGLELARSYRPEGVVLDLHLPKMDGWEVLAALKQDVETRHIPVHIVSADSPTAAGMRVGAIGHASKPLKQDDIDDVLEKLQHASATAEKLVLVVEDDPIIRRETVRIIGNGNVKTHEVETGGQALDTLRSRRYDLVVLDLGLPDMPGLELLERVASEKIHMPPVIVYTVRELTQDEELALRRYADSIILKDVRSQERLIDEVALFLHRVVSDLPEEKKKAIRHLHQSDEPLRGKKVLIVEDDIRTMFAMSRLLAGHGVSPLRAENGEKALAALDANPDVDLVLMDMMMPVMDGYSASRAIRDQQRFSRLPIIALTAKAMKEDRQKCLDAGASDYLSKPVDQDRLISLMRVWLSR